MEDRPKHDEEMSIQIQAAIAPLAAIINEMRKEIRTIREENKEFRDLIIGARFLGTVGKTLLMFGGIIGMIWAAFLVITHKS